MMITTRSNYRDALHGFLKRLYKSAIERIKIRAVMTRKHGDPAAVDVSKIATDMV